MLGSGASAVTLPMQQEEVCNLGLVTWSHSLLEGDQPLAFRHRRRALCRRRRSEHPRQGASIDRGGPWFFQRGEREDFRGNVDRAVDRDGSPAALSALGQNASPRHLRLRRTRRRSRPRRIGRRRRTARSSTPCASKCRNRCWASSSRCSASVSSCYAGWSVFTANGAW